ncbi:MAG: aminotransferase class III-fold pyridoxal phosphate-dependent enzyme [SAR324 cluster bacterium]|nr:aminotransferase class III-fold pyridoxal phosphate-dependent enzyme [SAR324 cluster bacterium]MBL7036181.1 aminotransferase class III-fold pyridoxal phosphate-dependent enzyme [SAR324 cluster bacterium]
METQNMNAPDSLWRPMTQHKMLLANRPKHIVKAEGCFIINEDGDRILDGTAGLWCVNVGHGRKELAEVAKTQMEKLAYVIPVMTSDPAVELSAKMLDMLGMEKGHVYFTSSGSEANETAFKMVRQYHLQTGNPRKHKIISRHRAYHGNTLATMTATGQAERKIGYEPLAPGFLHVPPPYPYRRHPKLTAEEHGAECVKFLEDTIIYEGEETVAAFIMEPMISGGGVLIPPDNYLSEIRKVCDKYNVLLILDEVVSGFGRTGKMFGHEHWGVRADIFTFAKGMASGYMPVAATVVKENIFEAFYGEANELKHFRHVNTYGGHPVAAAVSLKNIEIVERENLVANATKMERYIKAGLNEFADHPFVGEIRGKGLLIGIELVSDKETKAPLEMARSNAIVQSCMKQGVLVMRNGYTVPGLDNVLIMAPPLILQESEADMIIDAIGNGLKQALN